MNAIMFGVKIFLRDKNSPVSSDSTIGLYSVAGRNSELRWCQGNVRDVNNWNPSMLIKNGISRFKKEIRLINGGNLASPGSCSVTVHNLQKLSSLLETSEIFLPGLPCAIYRFDNATETVYWYGECGSPVITKKTIQIPLHRIHNNRISNILTKVNSDNYPYSSSATQGQTIPATFGKLVPAFDSDGSMTRSSLAKFIRTLDGVFTDEYTDDYFSSSGYTKTKDFPFLELVDPSANYGRHFKFLLRTDTGAAIKVEYPENTFLKITNGTGSDQIRKVTALTYYDNYLTVVIADFFKTDLYDGGGTEDDRSWGRLIKIYRRYDGDTFPCKDFYSSNNASLSTGAEIFTFDDEDQTYIQLAPYGYDLRDVGGTDKNKLIIDPKLFDQGNVDTQNSFLILPVANPYTPTVATLEDWNNSGETFWEDYDLSARPTWNGIYERPPVCVGFFSSNAIVDINNMVDGDSTTYCQIIANPGIISRQCAAIKVIYFTPPTLPKDFSFDACYIGIKMESTSPESRQLNSDSSLRIMLRRFQYGVKQIFNSEIDETTYCYVSDMPDFYFSNAPNTNNQDFFQESSDTEDFTGYTLFDTGITTKDEYETYIEGGIFFGRTLSNSATDDVKIYELCFIFKKSSDIKSSIYTPIHGRIFNDTFGARKPSTHVMSKPIDILEHICRLQNFIDVDLEQPTSGWGKTYPDGTPPIELGSDGSFDSSVLSYLDSYEAAGQLLDYNKGYTDKIKKSICLDFSLGNWINNQGNECVKPIRGVTPSPSVIVTTASLMDRNTIKIIDHPINSIYVEPFVQYDLDPATGKYRGFISINNTSASIYNASFVTGLSGDEAESLWNDCHSLWEKYKTVNKPPPEMTDLTWANGADSASISLLHLQDWVRIMKSKEVSFSGHLLDYGNWEEMDNYMVQFSHETNNEQKQCIAEVIDVNPNPPYDVKVLGLMLE